MWQDDSDVTKYWIANLDPKAKINGYGYNDGWNKVYGYINETGNKLSIPVGQTIGKNILLHKYSGGDAIDVYLTASNKTMNIESAWGCQEVDYNSGNATAKEFSRYEGGYFVFTTVKEDDPVDVEVSSPLISLSSAHILSLSCNTDGAMLYYTLDGTKPSASSIPYVAPLEVNGNCTIKAIAMKDGKYSEVSSYTISDFVCVAPVITQQVNSNTVTLSSETTDVSIYYTIDGKIPTKNSTLYTSAFDIDKSCIINAIAIKNGYKDSPVASQSVIYYPGEKPVPEPNEIIVTDNVAGQLALHVFDADKATATRWTISGEINGTDIAFLRQVFAIGKITDLNLSNTIIVSGGEPYYKTSSSEYYTENNVVGTNMFEGAKSLVSLSLPSTTLKIKSYAIDGCEKLASITIPDYCKELGSSVIMNCVNLSSIRIGKSLASFGSNNCVLCPKLRTIIVEADNENFVSIDGVLYSKSIVTVYKYPSAKDGTDYFLPSTVKVIGNQAFSDSKIEQVTLPNGLETIGTSAFDGCKNLRTIELPQSLKELGMHAFNGCAALSCVVIPVLIKELKTFTLGNCVNLRNVHIGASIEKINGFAFTGSTSLQTFTVSEDNSYYSAKGGILYSKDYTALVRCPLALYADEIILDDAIVSIKSNAFEGCKYIKKFKLLDGLKEIGLNAFSECAMEAIVVPMSVEKIDRYAFDRCPNLKDFTIPSSLKIVPSLMLSSCKSLEYLYIHKDVLQIDSYAFSMAKNLNTIECWIYDIDNLSVSNYNGEYTPFDGIKSDCAWHVPEGCANAYKAQDWWVDTWNIIDDLKVGIEIITAISDLSIIPTFGAVEITSPTSTTINIYNLQGRIVDTVNTVAGVKVSVPLSSGIYVVEGKKVHVK